MLHVVMISHSVVIKPLLMQYNAITIFDAIYWGYTSHGNQKIVRHYLLLLFFALPLQALQWTNTGSLHQHALHP